MSAPRRLVVVDPALSSLTALLQDLSAQPAVDILLAAPGQDVFAQIAIQLANADYQALDLYGLGSPESPESPESSSLAGLMLDAAQLPGHGAALAEIGARLKGGEISLYGNDIGQGGAGQAVVDALALQTGVSVQAFDVSAMPVQAASVGAEALKGADLPLDGASASVLATVDMGVSAGAASLAVGNAAPTAVIPLGNWARPVINTLSTPGHTDQVALLDVNGDGHADLLSVAVTGANAGSPAGWRSVVTVATGNGHGSFNTPADLPLPNQATQIRLADVDGDGRADVIATGWSAWNQPILSLLKGNAQGQFDAAVDVTLGLWADTLAVGDLDGDGRSEVIVGGRDPLTMNNRLQILPVAAGGGFGSPVDLPVNSFHATRLMTGDVDGNGRAELVALGEDAFTGNATLRVDGRDAAGQFQRLGETIVPGAAVTGLSAVADVTGDGRADALFTGIDPASGQATLSVMAGTASGGFAAAVVSPITVAASANPQGSGVWRGNSFWATALQTGDLDGDGRAEVLLGGFDSNLGKPVLQVLKGQADAHLTVMSSIVQSAQSDGITGLAVADVQHDGRLDVAVAGNSLSAAGYGQQISIDSAAAIAVAEDTIQTLVLRGTDVDGSIDHFMVSSLPAHGVLYRDAALTQPVTTTMGIAATQNSATLYFRPDADWNGDTRLEFFAVDNQNAASPTATLPISVAAVNDNPLAMGPQSGQAASFFTLQQYLGYQSNGLQNLINYAASHTPNQTVQTSQVDYSDTGSGGLLGGSSYWPAGIALGNYTSGGSNDYFFARVSAHFTVGAADTYTFRNVTDDGSFLLIDGQLVINDPTYHAQTAMTGSIALTPGAHSLELYFFEATGAGILELSAKSSTGAYQLMSGSGALFGAAGATTAEDSAVALRLLGSDVDGTVTGFRVSILPGHGTVYADAALTQVVTTSTLVAASNGGATLYFKPEANWSGSSSLSFVAVDNQGAASAQAATLPIKVAPVNDAPALTGRATTLAAVVQETAVTVTKAQLLAGWTDADPGDLLGVVNLTADHGAVVANADGSFTITGSQGYAGPMQLSYGVSDGRSVVDARLGYTVLTNWVSSAVSTTLVSPMKNLQLTGSAAINGTGNAADNALIGNAGNNALYGLAGNDRLEGGAGNDNLNGGVGADTLIGGLGDDVYTVDEVGDQVVEAAGEGTDSVYSGIAYTLGANVERLYLSGSAAINGTGNELANSLLGNAAANRLEGGAGNDNLNGGAGADTLSGGLGNDALTGGADADHFELGGAGLSGSMNLDSISDFVSGQDQLWLDSVVMSGFGVHAQALTSGMLRSGAGITTAADGDDHLIYNTSTGALYYDADGIGGSAAVQIAKLVAGTALMAGDVWLS